MARSSLDRWRTECDKADAELATVDSLDARASGNHFSVRWNLGRTSGVRHHNGHADLLRERIDGASGE